MKPIIKQYQLIPQDIKYVLKEQLCDRLYLHKIYYTL